MGKSIAGHGGGAMGGGAFQKNAAQKRDRSASWEKCTWGLKKCTGSG